MKNNRSDHEMLSAKLHEECGVFGMYDLSGKDVASSVYYGLFALQQSVIQRGQREKLQSTKTWDWCMRFLRKRRWSR